MSKRVNENDQTSAGSKVQNDSKSKIAFDQRPSPAIFKLHAIVCFELFDYLSFKDIISVGQTCKRFNCIAGNYFQDNYYAAENSLWKNRKINCNGYLQHAFSQYVQRIQILFSSIGLDDLKYIATNCQSLKRIAFRFHLAIDEAKIECIKERLARIEDIRFLSMYPTQSYEKILKHCSNLKIMVICSINLMDTAWLHQKYTMLEDIRIHYSHDKLDDFKIFLEQNPNIRSFSCYAGFLIANEDWLLITNANLDYFNIIGIDGYNANRVFPLLKRLHKRQFFKKLRLRVVEVNQNIVNEIGKLTVVEKLYFDSAIEGHIDFTVMFDVKEMQFDIIDGSTLDVNEFVSNFTRVERVSLMESSLEQLLILIKRCKKLKELRIWFAKYKVFYPNLLKLNKEREKLVGANKVTIYLHDAIYLATKWVYSDRDFKFIEIKRNDS